MTKSSYSILEQNLIELAKKLKTEIRFDFDNQCYVITGSSQKACDNTSNEINRAYLPQPNTTVGKNMFEGGIFESLEITAETPHQSPFGASSITDPILSLPTQRPRPFTFADIAAHPGYETESDEPEDKEEFTETFTFADNITNIKEVLTGPPTNNSKPPDYLSIIGNNTETKCSLKGRSIEIVGNCEEAVKEAAERFENLQTIPKRGKRLTAVVPCVHCPVESTPFGLYFCSLDRYVYKSFVSTSISPSVYVMLPTFKDASDNYQRPKGLLTITLLTLPPLQWILLHQQQLSLEERMQLASLEHGKRRFGNVNAGMAPEQTPLWGKNKYYIVRSSASKASPAPTRAPAPAVRREPVEDFPSLPSAPRPTVVKSKQNTRRIVRLTSPKASPTVASPAKSNLDLVREYNFHNIKTALADGLPGLLGFKGSIKLTAKLGKVLWPELTPENQKKIWNYYNIKNVLMTQHGVKPEFNDITTRDDDVITSISEILPESYGDAAYYEIHAKARNQHTVPYQPVVMYIKKGVVGLNKIETGTNRITEVDWVSLDRKFDFQMLLKTEETTRRDVKPYNTFIKKVAVDPITKIITYENVPDFLEVKSILFKKTTKYRIHFPFVFEITRVEKLPLSLQKTFRSFSIEKYQGDTGSGQVWYDLEVSYSTFDETFKSNSDLPVGKLASWKVEDILGSEGDASTALVKYIRCLLLLVEKCDAVKLQ